MKQVEAEYLTLMGGELGPVFWQLHKKLIELHIIWQQYRQLFGKDPETVELLNRTAGLLFKLMQDQIWDSVLLGISRMTDPPATRGKKNLTVQSLPPLIQDPGLRAEVQALCDMAVAEAAYAREHRNKRIAHQDHDYTHDPGANPLSGISREKVEGMLKVLRDVLNRLNSHFKGSTTFYEDFIDESGARVLIHKLRKLERMAAAASAGAP
jgi:hypothetical protein